MVYRQGTAGRSVCFVVEGELEVVKRDADGDARIGKVAKGQSVVGDHALDLVDQGYKAVVGDSDNPQTYSLLRTERAAMKRIMMPWLRK